MPAFAGCYPPPVKYGAVSDRTLERGQKFWFKAGYCTPGSRIEFHFDHDLIGVSTVGPEGKGYIESRVKQTTAYGDHRLVATCKSGTCRTEVVVRIRVLEHGGGPNNTPRPAGASGADVAVLGSTADASGSPAAGSNGSVAGTSAIPGSVSSSALARTGSDQGLLVRSAALALGLGGLLVMLARKRRMRFTFKA